MVRIERVTGYRTGRRGSFSERKEEYGDGVALRFRIIGGPHNGEQASRICGAKLTPKSTLTKFAVALKGASIASGERFSFANYVGTFGDANRRAD